MNILFLTTHVNTGGITSYILTLGEALNKSGHKVWVASSGGDCEDRFKAVGIKHIKINIRTKSELHPKVLLCLPALNRLIKENRINLIHAQTRVTQVLGFWLSRISRVKMVTTCHGFFKPRWFRKIFPCWGMGVIAISKPVAQHLIKDLGVPSPKVHLINNGIDLNRFGLINEASRQELRQKLGLGDSPLIGIISRLSDVKAIDVLIKAMPLILKELPSANLLIAGQGPQEVPLKQLTQDLSLTAQVHFRDTVNQTPDLLGALDVFVMPSLMEGLGLSVMEAQACGIPVVASRVGGLVDLIDDGISGFLVPCNDPTSLANRIIEVLRNPVKSRIMAQQARLKIEEYFSSIKMLKATLRVYEEFQTICQ